MPVNPRDRSAKSHENKFSDGIPTERILDQRQRIVGDFRNQLNPLRFSGVVDATLENTTAVTVSGNLDAVSSNSVVDKLFGWIHKPINEDNISKQA